MYRLFGSAGAGILVSGNILIDRRYLERAGNVCLDKTCEHTYDQQQRDMFKRWAEASKVHGSLIVAQLSCAGLKSPAYLTDMTIGPVAQQQGATTKGANAMKGRKADKGGVAAARSATAADLDAVVENFSFAAKVLCECGWDGVQIHAAHG